jgi:nitrite reductase/ring-hydroxylating ferredoxin subunit
MTVSINDWHDVAARDGLDPDFPLSVVVHTQQVGIYLLGDQVHAIDDVCPHAEALLSQGFVENGVVECPLHGAQFEIRTGKSLTDICDRDVTCFPVRVQEGFHQDCSGLKHRE